jgi:hypothetical protein
MLFLVLRAYWALMRLESLLKQKDFAALHELVRTYPVSTPLHTRTEMDRVCSAIDIACVWYLKQVLCLQRSAATTCLLRKHGIPAQMVIGARLWPFASHAWVEVCGKVVNDRSYVPDKFSLVLDRC